MRACASVSVAEELTLCTFLLGAGVIVRNRRHNELVGHRIENKLQAADVAAIARIQSWPIFDFVVTDRQLTRRTAPRHWVAQFKGDP